MKTAMIQTKMTMKIGVKKPRKSSRIGAVLPSRLSEGNNLRLDLGQRSRYSTVVGEVLQVRDNMSSDWGAATAN